MIILLLRSLSAEFRSNNQYNKEINVIKMLLSISTALASLCLTLSSVVLFPSVAFAGEDFSQFIKGGDMSYTKENELLGRVYRENNVAKDPFQTASDHGMNYVRLRLWTSYSGNEDWTYEKARTIEMAKRAVNNGMKVYLDLFYSDTWADREHQSIPHSWNISPTWTNADYSKLWTKVYDYTYDVINTMKQQGCAPSMVSLGNEENDGILFPYGQISKGHQVQFIELINQAHKAVKDVDPSIKTIIHHDFGDGRVNVNEANTFFRNLINGGANFDIMGISYYRFWSGDLNNLYNGLNTLATISGDKKILISEASYPWTLDNFQGSSANWYSEGSQLEYGFPASIQGQKDFMVKLMDIVAKTPQNKGIGVFYWPTDAIDVGRDSDNRMENASFWNARDNNNLLWSIDAFRTKVVIGGGIETPVDYLTHGATYRIMNRRSGKLIDVEGGSKSATANISQYHDWYGNNQKWTAYDVGGGYWKFVNVNSNMVIDVAGSSELDGANIIQYDDRGSANQQWRLIGIGGGYWKIVSRYSGKLIDVEGGGLMDGRNISQYHDNNGANQQWAFYLTTK